jgi:hypothetical protein
MTKIVILRLFLMSGAAGLVACGSHASLAPNDGAPEDVRTSRGDVVVSGAAGNAGNRDGAMGGADAGTDATMNVAPPPLELGGIVVWLDGDVGIDAPGTDQMTWTDRSAYRHVFVAQSAIDELPTTTRLNGHGAVRFNGRNRFISEHVPTAAQQDALTLGGDFVVAMAFLAEREVTHESVLTTSMLPWIASPPQPDLPLPPSIPAFFVELETAPALSLQAGASRLVLAGDFVLATQRMILSTSGGRQLRVRLNGQLQGGTSEALSNPPDGAYAPLYLGAWDFDRYGFEGSVAEMIIVRGPADQATEQALDDYLKSKFSL